MKRTLLLALIYISLFLNIKAQVHQGNLIITTQVEVDNFIFTGISGSLTIRESAPGSITNLNGLSELVSIGQMLNIINNSMLNSLSGLENLASVNSLVIQENPTLKEINSLTKLTSLGSLNILNNNSLQDISGLSNLSSVQYGLSIINNPLLNSIDPLSKIHGYLEGVELSGLPIKNINALAGVTGTHDLFIHDCDNLTEINGLNGIRSVWRLFIGPLKNLKNIDGLANMDTCHEYLDITGCDLVENLNGLSGMELLPDFLRITGNPSLTDLSGLSAYTFMNYIELVDNDMLEDLSGLSNLNTLNGILLYKNDRLQNLDGLKSLTSLGGIHLEDNPSLYSISALININVIGGINIINNDKLETLDGLNNITTIYGSIIINNNAALLNLDPLSGITGNVYEINITENPLLENIDGLSNISEPALIKIINNASLKNLNGFKSITYSGSLEIIGNQSLKDIDGLSKLSRVFSAVTISSNPSLTNINGLLSFSELMADYNVVTISRNNKLENIDGLQGLTRLFLLNITANNSLTSIRGLKNLKQVYVLKIESNAVLQNMDGLENFLLGTIEITANPSLTDYCGLYNYLSSSVSDVRISKNKINPSRQTILNTCVVRGSSYLAVVKYKDESLDKMIYAGGGMFILNTTMDTLQYYIHINNSNYMALYFHNAPEGSTGPIVKKITSGLNIRGYTQGIWTSSDSLQPLTPSLAQELKNGNIYLRYQTSTYPDEQLRGQLTNDQPVSLKAHLDGSQQVPPRNVPATGEGLFLLHGDGTALDYIITAQNLSGEGRIVFQEGAPGEMAGAPVKTVPSDTGSWTNTDAESLTPALVASLLRGHLNVNIKTSCYSDGEIRGQILIDENSAGQVTDVVDDLPHPDKFSLFQNYPNPFNPSTIINFQLAAGSLVIMRIYDALGNEVQTLINEEKPPGKYSIEWKPDGLASGIYFCMINAGNFKAVKKMIFMK